MKKLFFTVLFTCIVFVGCSNKNQEVLSSENVQQQENVNVVQNTERADRIYFTEKEADKQLKEIYSLLHLDKHEVYMVRDEMNVDLYFNDGIEKKEVESSRTFIMKIFVLQATSKYGTPIPYQQLILSKIKWNKVTSRVFINDIKVLEEKYQENKIKYYENMDIELKSRIVNQEHMQVVEKAIKQLFSSINDIIFEESFKGNILVVKVKGNKTYADKDIAKIKVVVENRLIQELEEESQKENDNIKNYLGVALQLYNDKQKYYEETFINGTKKLWCNEDWMNYPFFYMTSPK